MGKIISYIKERQREKDYDVNFFNKYIRAQIAYFLSYFLWKRKIHHSTITATGLLFSIISLAFFVSGEYVFAILGLLFYEMQVVFDYLDGTLARVRKIKTPKRRGGWLDGTVDNIGRALLIFSISYYSYIITGSPFVIMVGFVFVMSAQLRNISGLLAEKFDPINNKLTSEREKGIKRTFIGVLDDAIESCLDVLLIVSIIFNVPFVWLYIAGAYSVFCWIYGFIKTDFRFRKTYGY